MVRIEVSAEISRPVAEVFGYATDPTKVPEWNAIVEENKASEVPLKVGSKVTTRARFLGRRVDSVNEVTELVPNQKYVQSWRANRVASSRSESRSWSVSPRSSSRRNSTR
ncbi:MAG: hypothetical protein E6I22_04400 [Chloroflexi bacterium]|nr:MAG: hypothetical protein E6I22_04400 [Chloroflexota bacterium]